MPEINESKNGICEYAPPKKLKDGPRVYSEVILGKIKHNSPDKRHITLKIGRYSKKMNTVLENKPKSELTLDDEEFNNLIEYLEENYEPLNLGKGNYLKVSRNDSFEILKKIQALKIPNEQQAVELIESGLLTDKLQEAINTIKRTKAIEEFEDNLSQNFAEAFWQDWFSNNKWILGSEYLTILDERIINTGNIVDYLAEAFDGFVDIVEIKKPSIEKFWTDTQDHGNYVPTNELTKAIIQCQNYLYEIEKQSNANDFIERVGGKKIVKPRCLLIFGRSNMWNEHQKRAYRILNASLNQITILTYDHLLERVKNIYCKKDIINI